ncbi:MAG: serine/threonine-protein kinase [Phycisphaerales bacterium]
MGLLSQDADVQVFKAGEMIDSYRVMAELGRGAASIIYLVNDTKTKRIHAFKHVVKQTEKDERFLEQTEAEYDIGSKIDHPVIRKIERLIKKRSGLLAVSEMFLLMELVDGESLDKKPPRTFDTAADIFEQVAKGLAHMHGMGFVHADMKPNNVVVSAGGVVKVIDLGQSCAVNTVKKRIQGTPDYIAPEQVHRRPITHKTDIYNLGATMYWSLTKHFVPTALAKGDSLVGSVDDTLIKPPKHPIEINSRVPEMFDRLIMDCVQIEPANRPDSMTEVAERLNLIRAKLLAEAELRKSGSFRNVAGLEHGK